MVSGSDPMSLLKQIAVEAYPGVLDGYGKGLDRWHHVRKKSMLFRSSWRRGYRMASEIPVATWSIIKDAARLWLDWDLFQVNLSMDGSDIRFGTEVVR
jgi:hypothetical protein